uniref:Uncharacterized protein n=1 Tax=viral metagenome TaxID=1070528 RepID=A0A6C0C863_9ZZZZ
MIKTVINFWNVRDVVELIIHFSNIRDIVELVMVNQYFLDLIKKDSKFINWKHIEKEIQRLRTSDIYFISTYFIQACRFGYPDLCIDLFEHRPERIAKYDCVPGFRTSCRNNHFEIVKWLYRILLMSRGQEKDYFIQLINSNAGDCDFTIREWLSCQISLL